MNTKEQLNKIFRTDTDCLLADFQVGNKFIIDGTDAYISSVEQAMDGDVYTYKYTLDVDGDRIEMMEKDLWISTNDRNTFMEIFRDSDRLNTLSPDDRIEVFTSILLGSSDITVELLNDVLKEYNVSNIEVREIPKRDEKTIFIIYYAYGGKYTGDNTSFREIEAKNEHEALEIFKSKYRYEIIYYIREKQL